MKLQQNFNQKLAQIFLDKNPQKLAVAVSGGVDSLALTILLDEFCKKNKIKLFALTVDHKMRKSSSKEARELGEILVKKKISHEILTIPTKKIPQKNIEANLREVRYDLLCEFCKKNEIEFLFLGHHVGDVAENFLIRLFRGSGLDGLSTMAEILEVQKMKLIRPLLDFEKDEFKKFLRSKKIKWFEDETNEDEKFLRNKIRKFLESFEEKNLIQKRIKNTSDEIAQARDLFDEKMLIEAKKILQFVKPSSKQILKRVQDDDVGKLISSTNSIIPTLRQAQGFHDLSTQSGYFLIERKKFQQLDEKIALKILALVLMEITNENYKPRLENVKKLYQYLKNNESKSRDFYGCAVKKFDANFVIIFPQKNSQISLHTILKNIF